MVDADFHRPVWAHLELSHQLDADGAAGRGELDVVDEFPPDQPEIAVDVAQPHAEQNPREAVVQVADPDAVPRIASLEFVAVDQADVIGHAGGELRQFADIVLAVAVGIEDEFLGGRRKAASQRAAVAAVFRMRDHPHPWRMLLAKLLQHFGSVVVAAVVHHDHLVVVEVLSQDLEGLLYQPRQGRGVVIGGKENTDALASLGQNTMLSSPNRRFTIIAQDPAVRVNGRLLRAEVEVPAEALLPGPAGHRLQVKTALPLTIPVDADPFAGASDDQLVADPRFHAQNVYAILMRLISRFEFALGRRAAWSFDSHQLRVWPHARNEQNAWYSPEDRGLFFCYFPGRAGTVYTCLSHDIVAHEGAHALLDGLRPRYMDPSSPDQAAFHEAFGDIVALLSVFSLPGVIAALLGTGTLPRAGLTADRLGNAVFFSLAEQMGEEMDQVRGRPLRRSLELTPSPVWLTDPKFLEPHRRGEILVAALLNSFLAVWLRRLNSYGAETIDAARAAEEARDIAARLLTMCIRAIDYSPPVDVLFSDLLSAMLTADAELFPGDSLYGFRKTLRDMFNAYGIQPTSRAAAGAWEPPDGPLWYDFAHFDSLQRDPDEVFRFLWENRASLALHDQAETRVQSVRPVLRMGDDGFFLRETVAEYVQRITMKASDLARWKVRPPQGMPPSQTVTLFGGGALVFDQFGRLKFHVRNRIDNSDRQTARLDYLWRNRQRVSIADLHRWRQAL